MAVVNALTIDVEEHFQVHAFSRVIHQADWDSFESRVERNTHRILDLLDSIQGPRERSAKPTNYEVNLDHTNHSLSAVRSRLPTGQDSSRATFFLLGWIAKRHPHLIKEICARGHEVACHGYAHKCIFTQSREEFKQDVKRAKEILEDLSGVEIIGYRAPTYSISKDTLWALEILAELGFRYDSSIFPVRHDYYGFPQAPRFAFHIDFSDGDLESQLKMAKYQHELRHAKAGKSSQRQQLSLAWADTDAPPDSETPVKSRFTADSAAVTSAQLQPRLSRGQERPDGGEANHLFHCGAPHNCLVEFPLSTMTLLGRNLPCAGGGYFRLFPYRYTRHGLRRINEQFLESAVFYLHPWEIDPELPTVRRGSWLEKFRTYVNLRGTEAKLVRLLSEFQFAPLASLLVKYWS